MGASPSSAFFLDGRIVKEGMFSGRLSALPGRDALAFAEATIRPYREYRLSLWIRTGGAPRDGVWVEAIQLSRGEEIGPYPGSSDTGDRRLIVTGGTHDWRRFEVLLRGLHPAADKLRVVLRLWRGRAWRDGR